MLRIQAIAIAMIAVTFTFTTNVEAEQPSTQGTVEQALSALDTWMGEDKNGNQWREYLQSELLLKEIAKGDAADAAVIIQVLKKYQSDAAGLNLPRFVAVKESLKKWQIELLTKLSDDLPALAKASRNDFKKPSAEHLAGKKTTLNSKLNTLEQFLSGYGENGTAWKAYLDWKILQAELTSESASISKLNTSLKKLRSNQDGLELSPFSEVATALNNYIDVLSVSKIKNGQKQFAKQLELLAKDLVKYEKAPNTQNTYVVGRRVGNISTLGCSPAFVEAVRSKYAQPNLHISVAESFINAGATRPVVQTLPVTDYILGTSISGTAKSNGVLKVITVPSQNSANLRFCLSGKVFSDTVGSNGPVCIYTTGQTCFSAYKDIFLTPETIRTNPSVASAETFTNINAIVPQGRFGSRLIEKIAWKKAGKQKGLAESIASSHAEDRIQTSFDKQFEEEGSQQLAESQERLEKRVRLPLKRIGEEPEMLALSSTSDNLLVTMLKANRSQLGAPSAPPAVGTHAITVRAHETVANNMATVLLSGFTLTDDWLRAKLIEAKKELPPELKDEAQDPWSLTFDNNRPVTVSFKDGGLFVVIRGRKFTSGSSKYGAMNISVAYKFEQRPEGIALVRTLLEILPPGFKKESGRLSASQSALVEILNQRLDTVFKKEIPAEGIELPENMRHLGKLTASELTSKGGWLSVGWDLPPKTATKARATQVSFVQ